MTEIALVTDRDFALAQDEARTLEEVDRLGELRLRAARARLDEAIADFRLGTLAFLDLIDTLEADIREIGFAPGMEGLLRRVSAVHRQLHAAERSAPAKEEEIGKGDDLADMPLDLDALPGGTPAEADPITHQPETLEERNFSPALAEEYVRFFQAMSVKPRHRDVVASMASKALAREPRYRAVGNQLGIPWWFIAGIHMLESTFNTTAHLHNGDPLDRRTRRVPAGRPRGGTPPFSWEESAKDALRLHKLDGLADWSLARALWRWERYNGFGYRPRRIPTPYLWSFSTVYDRGKFVGDRRFSKTAVSKQCGAAVLLKQLHLRGKVELDGDLAVPPSQDSEGADPPPVPLEQDAGPFGAFWRSVLPDVRHFSPVELLVKGNSHAQNGLNTDPPEHLWQNAVKLVRVLETIRVEIGKPIRLNSVYRSPAYNARIGGASTSQHMQFKAADFTVLNTNTGPRDWARTVTRLREANLFAGGVGIYGSFVHVDVRGHNRTWTG